MDDHLQALNIKERRIVVEPTVDLEEVSLDDDIPGQTTRIGIQADPSVCKELALFLKDNRDIFAWSHKNMLGINLSTMVHKLNVCPSFPTVRQKKRVFAQERDKAIAEEVRKLLETDFIREVYYPEWLANVVMVKKANGKWRMCVDFTDLNKACPKDSYPLPCINLIVDSMIRRNVEVYVDDMLVKSAWEVSHLDDLQETFDTLHLYNMKLNPSKCVFGVVPGKFLGFMVLQREVKVNPDKV
ncbi:uncharacterized protein LOC142606245 [Castanea sativa]|uniref:uncharacterized protein LOC142606245 n=1 Tax=Castanea sativa TaxID=21020 RepID=UPI003F64E02E